MYSFEGLIWNLYEQTKDVNLVRLLANSDNYDLSKIFTAGFTLDEPADALRKKVAAL